MAALFHIFSIDPLVAVLYFPPGAMCNPEQACRSGKRDDSKQEGQVDISSEKGGNYNQKGTRKRMNLPVPTRGYDKEDRVIQLLSFLQEMTFRAKKRRSSMSNFFSCFHIYFTINEWILKHQPVNHHNLSSTSPNVQIIP